MRDGHHVIRRQCLSHIFTLALDVLILVLHRFIKRAKSRVRFAFLEHQPFRVVQCVGVNPRQFVLQILYGCKELFGRILLQLHRADDISYRGLIVLIPLCKLYSSCFLLLLFVEDDNGGVEGVGGG